MDLQAMLAQMQGGAGPRGPPAAGVEMPQNDTGE